VISVSQKLTFAPLNIQEECFNRVLLISARDVAVVVIIGNHSTGVKSLTNPCQLIS
jgi:hypothetical protein